MTTSIVVQKPVRIKAGETARISLPAGDPNVCQFPGEVLFALNRSFVAPDERNRSVLQRLAQRLGSALDTVAKLLIVGHTDSTGSAEVNARLSVRRAESVKAVITRDTDTWDRLFRDEGWAAAEFGPIRSILNEPRPDSFFIANEAPRKLLFARYFAELMSPVPAGAGSIRTIGCGRDHLLRGSKTAPSRDEGAPILGNFASNRRVEFFFHSQAGASVSCRDYPRWTVVCRGPGAVTVPQEILDQIEAVKDILAESNQNNVTRTAYYLQYWKQNPEVLWCLVAHGVVRNVGYQMSDLKRYRIYADAFARTGIALSRMTVPFQSFVNELASQEIDKFFFAMFALLEATNFVVFHDVVPQLEAYRFCKTRMADKPKSFVDSVFRAFQAEFGFDSFAVEEWPAFFAAARAAKFWLRVDVAEIAQQSAIQRHYMAIAVNEQHTIEALIFAPEGSNPYLDPLNVPIRVINQLLARHELNFLDPLLVFPGGLVGETERLFNYSVDRFTVLADRIQTAVDLYRGLLTDDPERQVLWTAWLSYERNLHSGSRRVYDQFHYDTSPISLSPTGQTYSSRLDHQFRPSPFGILEEAVEAWPPEFPATHEKFKHIHATPIPPRIWSKSGGHLRFMKLPDDFPTGRAMTEQVADRDRPLKEILF